jgi:magnesium chelatase subunit I
LFNIMQEGDVQIKGYPVRLPLDVALVFSANPEDYTARGKIITPLKDRIGSEIRTHYPELISEGIAITAQEAWTDRTAGGDLRIEVPPWIREIVEQVAFLARDDKRVDKRSGVSQRLPISTMELVVSNAERRALLHGEALAVPRVGDLYTALPGITGKIELEYEGEMRGADTVVRELIRQAVGRVFDGIFSQTNTQQIEQWFNLGGTVKIADSESADASLTELKQIQGLLEKLSPLKVNTKTSPELTVSAAEFLLEGMYAHKRLSRSEERGFGAAERAKQHAERAQSQRPQQERDKDDQDLSARNRTRRGFN